MDNLHKKSTQAERTKKYKNSKQIKQLNMDLNPEEMQLFENVLKKYNMRKKQFFVSACKYCIDHDINFDD